MKARHAKNNNAHGMLWGVIFLDMEDVLSSILRVSTNTLSPCRWVGVGTSNPKLDGFDFLQGVI